MKGKKEDRFLFLWLVIVPLGVLACFIIWAKYGFGYAILEAIIFALLAYLEFRSGKFKF